MDVSISPLTFDANPSRVVMIQPGVHARRSTESVTATRALPNDVIPFVAPASELADVIRDQDVGSRAHPRSYTFAFRPAKPPVDQMVSGVFVVVTFSGRSPTIPARPDSGVCANGAFFLHTSTPGRSTAASAFCAPTRPISRPTNVSSR